MASGLVNDGEGTLRGFGRVQTALTFVSSQSCGSVVLSLNPLPLRQQHPGRTWPHPGPSPWLIMQPEREGVEGKGGMKVFLPT